MNIPEQYNQLMPYLIISRAAEFLTFSKDVFGATEQLIVPKPDGSVMHAELRIGSTVIMFADANEDHKATSCGLCLLVESVDDVYKKAISHGATSLLEPEDKEYGRSAGFQDSFGNTWWLMEMSK
jgi:uncharacterized glyoxalase superfamily protein PhnB